jgi:hypothetical protein
MACFRTPSGRDHSVSNGPAQLESQKRGRRTTESRVRNLRHQQGNEGDPVKVSQVRVLSPRPAKLPGDIRSKIYPDIILNLGATRA